MSDQNHYDRSGPGTSATPTAPRPASLQAIDMQRKVINQVTFVIGPYADGLLDHLYAQTAGPKGGRTVLSRPGEASLLYLPLRLGDIRGFKTQLHLYGFGDDPRLVSTVSADLPHGHGLIITLGSPAPGGVLQLVARARPSIPAALLGSAEQRSAWRAHTGMVPCFEGEQNADAVFPALKEVSRAMLGALKKQG